MNSLVSVESNFKSGLALQAQAHHNFSMKAALLLTRILSFHRFSESFEPESVKPLRKA
jgi:hypothetical protein